MTALAEAEPGGELPAQPQGWSLVADLAPCEVRDLLRRGTTIEDGGIGVFSAPHAVIGEHEGVVLIVSPADRGNLAWFEIKDGVMERKEEKLERLGELAGENPLMAAVLEGAEEAEKQASRAHQALYS